MPVERRSPMKHPLPALAFLLLTFPAYARAEDSPHPFALGQAADLVADENGRPRALGPDYEAEFTAEGARFLPVLGDGAPRTQDLTFGALGMARGERWIPLDTTAPQTRGPLVVYTRAEGIEERFEVTRAGLEHSLWIQGPIPGEGDLVVHIGLGGELRGAGAAQADGSHRFDRGFGGIRYGHLVAIDALGRQVAGKVELAPNGLTWTVAADFVDQATWPLLLDPLVSSAFSVSSASGSSADRESDVAYDLSNDVYLAVWQRTFSGGDRAIRAQRFSANGTLLGPMLSISNNISSRSPRVANVNLSNRFAVTWTQTVGVESQVRARAVAAADGALSNNLLVRANSAGPIQGVDIAGESTLNSPPLAWIVYGDWPEAILGRAVSVPATGDILLSNGFAIEGSPARLPRISHGPDGNGRMAVIWRSQAGAGPIHLRATTFGRNGNLFHAPQTVMTADSFLGNYALDGGRGADGISQFVLAYETWSFDPEPKFQLRLRTMRSGGPGNPLSFAPAELFLSAEPETTSPTVAWRGDKAYVAYTRNGGKQVSLLGVDGATCLPCDLETAVTTSSSTLFFRDPALCLQAHSAGPGSLLSKGVLLWSQQSTSLVSTPSTTLRARLLDAFSPMAEAQNLGGGCAGATTYLLNSPPAKGNAGLRAQLFFPGPGSLLAIFNIAPPSAPLVCGPCQWVPFAITFPVPVPSGSSLVEFPLPIPCTVAIAGAVLDTQWTVVRPGATACPGFLDLEVSNIQRLILQ